MYFSFQYLAWHYSYGLPNLFTLTKEFIRFIFNFFSINLFFRTLFSPMFSVESGIADEQYAEGVIALFVSSMVMRVLGFILRTLFIIIGLLSIIFTTICMMAVIIAWLLLPVLLLLAVYACAAMIFT